MFDWPDYLDFARRIAAETDNEAALRTAISRAYYAVFNFALERLVEHGFIPGGPDPHRRVWRAYQSSDNPDCRRIGAIGFLLRDRRNVADYRRHVTVDIPAEVMTSLAFADRLFQLLDQIDPAEGCGAVESAAGMRS